MLSKGEFAKKMAEKCGQTWNEIPSDVKKEIQDAIIAAFKKRKKSVKSFKTAREEQEEITGDKADYAMKLVKKFENDVPKIYKSTPEVFMMEQLLKVIGWDISKKEYNEWWELLCDACEEVFGSGYREWSKYLLDAMEEQEEDTTPPWVGRKYNGGIDFDADGNLQVITPDEDDDDDGEVPPLFDSEQERHDIALATTYCLGESFIDNDGDLDDIYYAVLKVFDSTYDAPATTDYKEVLQWCRKYYKQIEKLITTEEQEEQIFKVRTKQGFVEVPLSSEVVDAFHDNLDPRYEDMDTQAALKGINGGARLAALIAGMMEQGYKPTPDEQHILELHYNAKKAATQSQADSSNRNINAYSD